MQNLETNNVVFYVLSWVNFHILTKYASVKDLTNIISVEDPVSGSTITHLCSDGGKTRTMVGGREKRGNRNATKKKEASKTNLHGIVGGVGWGEGEEKKEETKMTRTVFLIQQPSERGRS